MKDVARMILSVVVSAAVFLILFIGLNWNLIFCILLCVGLYFGLFFLLKPRRKIAGVDVDSLPDGDEIQKLLDDAEIDLEAIKNAKQQIEDPVVRSDADSLHDTAVRILAYLNENPDKIRLARRFFTYYLDTAAKLLTRYIDFQQTGLRSPEVMEILNKTAKALPVLDNAFERQFTHLMEGELMDVEADIGLLESTLKMEGEK